MLTCETLLRRVWQSPDGKGSMLVRPFVKSLRRKLGDGARDPSYIFAEPKVGYRMPSPDHQ